MNKKVIGLIMLGVIATTASLTGCGKKEEAPAKLINIVTQEQKDSRGIAKGETNLSTPDQSKNSDIKKDVQVNTTNGTNVEGIAKGEPNPAEPVTFTVSSLAKDTKIEINTSWEKSPDGKYEATVEGKGENSEEEGIADIVIRDISSGEMKKLNLVHSRELQRTPKVLEWADDNNVYVVVGHAFGTVTRGGKIYKVNIIDGTTSLAFDTKDKEEFTSIHNTDGRFTADKYVYEDDNYTKGHTETTKLP